MWFLKRPLSILPKTRPWFVQPPPEPGLSHEALAPCGVIGLQNQNWREMFDHFWHRNVIFVSFLSVLDVERVFRAHLVPILTHFGAQNDTEKHWKMNSLLRGKARLHPDVSKSDFRAQISLICGRKRRYFGVLPTFWWFSSVVELTSMSFLTILVL